MTYEDLIDQFVYEAFPQSTAPAAVRFEAVAAEVFGTKQRRQGPMPPPEAQVAVRDILRQSGDEVHFFTPWGARKQADGAPLDILEFAALKQLDCLRAGLFRFGVRARFHFRIDDLMDQWLFGRESVPQIAEYTRSLEALARTVLGGATNMVPESRLASYASFAEAATLYAPVFREYLLGRGGRKALADIGWAGDIPPEQREYYYRANRVFYPDREPETELARYFAGTLARAKLLGARAKPDRPHVMINFHAPVPGSPVEGARLYYRTLPAKFTHAHKAPWIGRGYLAIQDPYNTVGPRIYGAGEAPAGLVPHTVRVGDVPVACPYVVEDGFPVRTN